MVPGSQNREPVHSALNPAPAYRLSTKDNRSSFDTAGRPLRRTNRYTQDDRAEEAAG